MNGPVPFEEVMTSCIIQLLVDTQTWHPTSFSTSFIFCICYLSLFILKQVIKIETPSAPSDCLDFWVRFNRSEQKDVFDSSSLNLSELNQGLVPWRSESTSLIWKPTGYFISLRSALSFCFGLRFQSLFSWWLQMIGSFHHPLPSFPHTAATQHAAGARAPGQVLRCCPPSGLNLHWEPRLQLLLFVFPISWTIPHQLWASDPDQTQLRLRAACPSTAPFITVITHTWTCSPPPDTGPHTALTHRVGTTDEVSAAKHSSVC